MSEIIHYLGNNPSIISFFRNYLEQEGFSLKEFEQLTDLDLEKSPVLLLIEPYYQENWNQYFAFAKIWRRYCYYKKPNVRLIILGEVKCKHPAFLNILDLPENFSEFLNRQKPMDSFGRPKRRRGKGTYKESDLSDFLKQEQIYDPWDENLSVQKTDLLKVLIQFFDGHANQGLRIQFNKLRQTFISAYNRYKKIKVLYEDEPEATQEREKAKCYDEIFEKLIQPYGIKEWKNLYERWCRYLPLFHLTPFVIDIEKTDREMKDLNIIMDNFIENQQQFEIEEFDFKLRVMHKRLKDIEKILRLSS